jgi:murein DD-endopeptidase MepM/ murein hydrolase activator NlpD
MMNVTQDLSQYYYKNLEELKGRKDPEALKAAAKEMESLFAYEMIKEMRKTVDMAPEKGLGTDTYMSMFDMEIARLFAERGLGLQDILLKGMSRAGKSEGAQRDAGGNIPPPAAPSNEEAKDAPKTGVPDDAQSVLPVHGWISSPFGMRRHPIYSDNRFHYGVDIAAPEGTNIYPMRAGTVIFSGEAHGYGKMVVIRHEDGLISKYAHNEVNLVKEGDPVNADTVIAKVGSTGLSTGPHLHFEISRNGERIDPMKYLAKNEIKEKL